MAFRFASERIDAAQIKRTTAGALRVPGLVTRSGVFEYRDAAGNVVREWRPPEEVQKADNIASMQDLPVTIRHPKSFVDPATWRSTAIGHVSAGTPKADAATGGVAAELVISPADAQANIGKDLKEISYGYKVRIDATPGVVPDGYPDAGKAYDVVQRDIIGNHVALGPANWGRQGSAVSLRLDSAGDECPPVEHTDGHDTNTKGSNMFKIRLDGIEFTAESEAALQAKVDAHYAAKALESSKTAAAAEKARADAAEALNTKLQKDVEQARADAAAAPAKLAARNTLETEAKASLGATFKCDGKSDREIQLEVIRKYDSAYTDVVDGKPVADAIVAATYGVWAKHGVNLAKGARADASTRHIATTLGGNKPAEKTDGVDVDPSDSDAAKARRLSRIDNANDKAFTYTKEAADAALSH